MTFITDQLRCLDIQLDKLQLIQLERVHVAENFSTASTEPTPHGNHRQHQLCPSEYAQNLQRIIRQLGVASNHILSPQRVLSLLMEANISHNEASINADSNLKYYEQELEWLLLNKATLQTYGIVLNSLIDQTIPLSRDLFYWDEVMSSYRKTAFYWLQTSPWRLISTLREIYMESMKRLQELREMERPEFMRVSLSGEGRTRRLDEDAEKNSESLSETAKKFYGLVKNTINDQANFHRLTALSPFSLIRHEILQKQATIRKLREMQASALGILIGEGLSFGFDEDKGSWRGIIERAVLLMENVVRNVVEDNTLDEFEEKVFIFDRSLEGSVRHSEGLSLSVRPTVFLSTQLQEILCYHLPNQTNASRNLISAYGRPSRIIRYWIPATALLLSSTTILRILVNRQAALKTWFTELGTTTLDFWTNWVVEPIRKIIDTIRHNENSEVALMSRKSLAADMESLERMVVEFAIDNPNTTIANKRILSQHEIEVIRQNTKEGDLTPVLKVYEHDLRTPFRGAIRGELIRALLIQIQKTKVDVEVAISGIDHLLKSQELVFGFVGLTPGLFITLVTFRWFAGMFGGEQQRGGKGKERIVRRLRNVDRILTGSGAAVREENQGCLNYLEHGTLLCDLHVIREDARQILARPLWAEFVADLDELADARSGVKKQRKVAERIRWAFARWLI